VATSASGGSDRWDGAGFSECGSSFRSGLGVEPVVIGPWWLCLTWLRDELSAGQCTRTVIRWLVEPHPSPVFRRLKTCKHRTAVRAWVEADKAAAPPLQIQPWRRVP